MALDAITPLTAPMPAPPVRQFSFTDFQTNNPTAPPPGDRLDAEFDRANGSISDTINWASVSLNTDGTIRDGVIGESNLQPDLFDDVAADVIAQVQPLVDQAGAFASAAQTSANTALGASNTASAQATVASGAASQALASQGAAATARDLALGYSNAASAFADDAQNAENDATGAAAKASDYAVLTQAWAEHMPDTIPPNILAVADVTGDHWSARWWANKAAGAFGALSSLYMGALPSAPGSTPTGDPLPTGAIYYNTTTQQPYVWTGTQWLPFTVPAKAVVIGLVYQATAGQTVFDTNTNDLSGSTYPVTADPLEVYVNGVRVPQTEGAFTGDWDHVNNLVTFNTPLAAGSIVMIDVLTADTSSGVLPGGPYLPLAGSTMTGPLILAGDGTGALQPVTRRQLDTKVNLAGGTMTGDLLLRGNPTTANMAANKAYADLMVPLAGGTMTGFLTLSANPTASMHAVSKIYADTALNAKLALAGGTLTGDLTLRGPPSTTNMAATKGYVDAGVNAALPLAGGTMTGDLTLRGSPTTANMAANKSYVDTTANAARDAAKSYADTQDALRLALAGGTMTGDLTLRGSPTTTNMAANKGYVDTSVSNAVAGYLPLTGGSLSGSLSATLFQTTTGGIGMNASFVGSTWTADANVVVFRFSGNWGWQWDRATGRLHYVNNAGTDLFAINQSGTGISCPQISDSFFANSWDGLSYGLYVGGTFSGNILWSASFGAGYTAVQRCAIAPGGAALYFWYTASAAFGVSGGTVSDRRTKSNITPAGDALTKLLAMPVYECDRTVPEFAPQHLDFSVMSDEVAAQVPSMVIKSDDPNIFDMIDPLVTDSLLIKAIQQLTERVTALEARP